MGKFLLLLVASAAAVGALTLRQTLLPTLDDTQADASKLVATVLAEQAAWDGLEEAAEALSAYDALPSGPSTLVAQDDVSGSRYRVVLTPDPGAQIVTASAHAWAGAPGATGGRAIMEVDFALRPRNGSGYEPPDFMRGLLRSNRVLYDGGNMSVLSEDSSVNADVYTNEYFSPRNTSNIPGFLYHAGTMTTDQQVRNQAIFQPNDNPDGLYSTQSIDPFVIPRFEPADYLDKATRVTPSQLTLENTVALGTQDNPAVWYVDGNLTVGSSRVVLEGYGIFIVNGSLNVTNQFEVRDSSPQGNSVAFYVRDDININNEVDLAGQFFANGTINLSARSTITGSLTAGGIQFGRTTALRYRSPRSWQTEPLFGPSPGSRLQLTPVAYRAWDPTRSV